MNKIFVNEFIFETKPELSSIVFVSKFNLLLSLAHSTSLFGIVSICGASVFCQIVFILSNSSLFSSDSANQFSKNDFSSSLIEQGKTLPYEKYFFGNVLRSMMKAFVRRFSTAFIEIPKISAISEYLNPSNLLNK